MINSASAAAEGNNVMLLAVMRFIVGVVALESSLYSASILIGLFSLRVLCTEHKAIVFQGSFLVLHF